MRKNVLSLNDVGASLLDGVAEFLGKGVTCQLISSTALDPNNGNRGGGSGGEPGAVAGPAAAGDGGGSKFRVTFDWEVEKLGVPGAVIVKNNHGNEFFLKTITLDDVPGHAGHVVFVANSWVYPANKYRYNRVFFSNDVSHHVYMGARPCLPIQDKYFTCGRLWVQTYLPSQMPVALKPYRDDELRNLRGDDQQGPYQEHDRVYRYDVYNDPRRARRRQAAPRPRRLPRHALSSPWPHRPQAHPNRYAVRVIHRPDRQATDASSESRLSPLEQIYVPRDERFGHLKMADFLGYSIRAITEGIVPAIRTYVDLTPGEFDSFQDILNLYEGCLKLPNIPALKEIRKRFPLQLVKSLLPTGGDYILKLPIPQIIKEDKDAWRTDEEFAREVLAGVNPMMITRLTDALLPARRRQAAPLAIELSEPLIQGGLTTAKSTVYTPASAGVEAWVWQLAKAYVAVNDSGWHQLVSHWGVAVEDATNPYKVRLLIEDYPYAADGLAIWHAIEQWVGEYLAIYYPDDGVLCGDAEVQAWWKEVREVGHGDLKDSAWWPKMQFVSELANACTTIIWIASALHAAVNFGQYPYAGYLPTGRRTPPTRCTSASATRRRGPSDAKALEAFRRFSDRLVEIEGKVVGMNRNPQLKNRSGPAKFHYMLLYPNTSDRNGDAAGSPPMGIPNSISI
ncbi:hypothetical protein GUJ93_ZPchr0003g18050 [Zizania palustris]|uniref:linoleate 9S-lipoxygenase n=1 Tax=Zizania palustris TaxID=103762 RepID=A0A8J5VWV9_ZIZPA|nr:hypothetical protein GUJ93_ZPchr0003g18050 [Zizania palustris]